MPESAKRVRIAVVGASPCPACSSACCRQTVSEYAVLLQGDERRRFAAWSQDLSVKDDFGTRLERVIVYRNGRCPFLASDGLCDIYEDRPQACREFECTRHFNQHGHGKHGLFLRGNPDVLHLLKSMPASDDAR